MNDVPHEPEDLPPFDDADPRGDDDELFESERNMERVLDYLDLLGATEVQTSGSFDADDLGVNFTITLDNPPQDFHGFAVFVKDSWVDICLLRDWSRDIRVKFRDRASEIMNTIGLQGVSLYFVPDEDTLYMTHRIFTEGLNFDVFRACVWSLVDVQSRVAAILERDR